MSRTCSAQLRTGGQHAVPSQTHVSRLGDALRAVVVDPGRIVARVSCTVTFTSSAETHYDSEGGFCGHGLAGWARNGEAVIDRAGRSDTIGGAEVCAGDWSTLPRCYVYNVHADVLSGAVGAQSERQSEMYIKIIV